MILQPHLTRNGYLNIRLNKNGEGKDFSIHRLVAKAFIPNPESKSFINHKDGNRFNNYFENLEWSTPSENNQHALKMGLSKSGANRSDAKLTNEDVKFIRENYIPRDSEFGGAALARKFNVSVPCINFIIKGKTYKNID